MGAYLSALFVVQRLLFAGVKMYPAFSCALSVSLRLTLPLRETAAAERRREGAGWSASRV